MPSVIMMNVVMLNVMAPSIYPRKGIATNFSFKAILDDNKELGLIFTKISYELLKINILDAVRY